jgi:hypothetical protein
MKKRIYIAYLLLAITYVAAMGTLLGACQPFNHYWQVNPNPGSKQPLSVHPADHHG